MRKLVLVILLSTVCPAQKAGSSVEAEEPIQKTVAGKQLAKEDVQCGNYFWRSQKSGATFLYYFFGSAEWGKGKAGYYQQSMYRVVVNDQKDPPTVQRIQDANGNVTEVRVNMTKQELQASASCLSEK